MFLYLELRFTIFTIPDGIFDDNDGTFVFAVLYISRLWIQVNNIIMSCFIVQSLMKGLLAETCTSIYLRITESSLLYDSLEPHQQSYGHPRARLLTSGVQEKRSYRCFHRDKVRYSIETSM